VPFRACEFAVLPKNHRVAAAMAHGKEHHVIVGIDQRK
jgi:hypothetical protein